MAQAIVSPSMLRHEWLERALHALRPLFEEKGFAIPATIRVSIGWPKGARGGKAETIGQCWDHGNSSDKHYELFISPVLGNKEHGVKIIGTLVHELVHSVVGLKAAHGAKFKACATALGLEGKMTATTEGPELVAWAEKFIAKHGDYPAGNINHASKRLKQTTRLIKCECGECGYVARVTRKWIDDAGAPYCGVRAHGRMGTDYEPEEDDE